MLKELIDAMSPITKEEMEHANRWTFYPLDWNEDYRISLKNFIEKLNLEKLPVELQSHWDAFLKYYTEHYKKALRIRGDNPSPMVTGRANFNYKRAEKLFDRERKTYSEMDRDREIFAKRVNSWMFKNRMPAEKKKELERNEQDKVIFVGTAVHDFCFGRGIVRRVNKKTYTVEFNNGSKYARDKRFVEVIKSA